MAIQTDDIPEEDKILGSLDNYQVMGSKPCHHEYYDLAPGMKRGDPTINVQFFYCKFCLKIRKMFIDQSDCNLEWDEEEHTDFRDK